MPSLVDVFCAMNFVKEILAIFSDLTGESVVFSSKHEATLDMLRANGIDVLWPTKNILLDCWDFNVYTYQAPRAAELMGQEYRG